MTTKPKEEKVADATVTDGEIKEVEGTQEAETTETIGTEEEQTEIDAELSDKEKEHRERSALGRRISAIERSTNERLEDISGSVERLLSLQSGAGSEEETEEEFVTRKTLRQELKAQRDEEDASKNKYQIAYGRTIDGFGLDEDGDIHAAIIKELEANFNFVHSSDGTRDAEANYHKATRAFYNKQLSFQKKKVPIRGNGEKTPPLGSGVEGDEIRSTGKDTDSDLPPLDDAAKDFIKRRGLSEEQVKKYLKADLPLSITGINNEARK